MPSPSTPRRGVTQRGSAPTGKPSAAAAGSPPAPYDHNPVRDRIRQWQAQGGGVVVAADGVAEAGDEEPPVKSTPEHIPPEKAKPSPKTRTYVEYRLKDSPPPKASRQTSRKVSQVSKHSEEKLTDADAHRQSMRRNDRNRTPDRDRPRSISTPRKRVVSDEHWRAKKPSPRSAEHRKSGRLPRPSRSPRDEQEAEKDKTEDLIIKDSHDIPEYADDMGASGARVSPTPPASRTPSRHLHPPVEREIVESANGSTGEGTPPSSSTKEKTPSPSQSKEVTPDHSIQKGADATQRKHSATHRKMPPKTSPKIVQGAFANARESKKMNKGILGQVIDGSKRMFQKNEPPPALPPDSSAVEKWLDGTDPSDDPFVVIEPPPEDGIVQEPTKASAEHTAPVQEPPAQFPEALRPKRRSTSAEAPSATGFENPNSAERAERHSRRRQSHRRKRHTRSPPIDDGLPAVKETTEAQQASSEADEQPTHEEEAADLEQGSPSLSQQSLRRRGARKASSRSTRKERRISSRRKEASESPKLEAPAPAEQEDETSAEPSKPVLPPRHRQFPSVGDHRLSTIMSVETLNTNRQQETAVPSRTSSTISKSTLPQHSNSGVERSSEATSRHESDVNNWREPTKGGVTMHSDLMSVLSLPRASSKSIRSSRSIRSRHNPSANATIEDIMSELASDERRYLKELRTLVDGVIPVLLSSVLSKSGSALTAGLFSAGGPAKDDAEVMQPIVDMGVALERLKLLHKRIPVQDPQAFLTWSHGAQRTYGEYLKAWRLGFQDVIINLEPAQEQPYASGAESNLEGGLPRNEHGDVVNTRGERVDVAFLLRRPLVRIKYLAKTVKSINVLQSSSEAQQLSAEYEALVAKAKARSSEEQARLEDEAAANIDTSKTRDLATLEPLSGVVLERSRRVRARDCFNLTLLHSSGQRIDCRVELLLRDDAPGQGSGGDVLVCEIGSAGRHLLFPPIELDSISARNGDLEKEIIVMIRGSQTSSSEWHELLALTAEDEQTGFEWAPMLGLTPVPPRLERTQSFVGKMESQKRLTQTSTVDDAAWVDTVSQDAANISTISVRSRNVSPSEVTIPIGEESTGNIRRWKKSTPKKGSTRHSKPADSPSKGRSQPQKPPTSTLLNSLVTTPLSAIAKVEDWYRQSDVQVDHVDSPDCQEALQASPSGFDQRSAERSPATLKRSRATRVSRHLGDSPPSSTSSPDSSLVNEKALTTPPPPRHIKPLISEEAPILFDMPTTELSMSVDAPKKRRSHTRAKSSTPTRELPAIPKMRSNSASASLSQPPEQDDLDLDEPHTPVDTMKPPKRRSRKQRGVTMSTNDEEPPAPPAHKSPSPTKLKKSMIPDFGAGLRKLQRRSSSPLKHQYEPSSPSSSSPSASDQSTVKQEDTPLSSESSSEGEAEDADVLHPLKPVFTRKRSGDRTPPRSLPSLPTQSLGPSSSASQAPYKTVPSQPQKAERAIATVWCWSNTGGTWLPFVKEECSIVVTPGQIDVHIMSAAHSGAQNPSGASSSSPAAEVSPQPLLALGVTPLVLIHQGTALDISIRSPPLAHAQRKKEDFETCQFMFRSRSAEECQELYYFINWARMNNPTWIQLEHARATSAALEYGGASFNREPARKSSWFGGRGNGIGRRSSYRASSASSPSIAKTATSRNSVASAFSAWRHFRRDSSRYSVARSTVTSRHGGSSDRSEGDSLGTCARVPGADGNIGLANCRVDLYERPAGSGYRKVGKGFLTIRYPQEIEALAVAEMSGAATPEATASTATSPSPTPAPAMAPSPAALAMTVGLENSTEKRVIVTSKKDALLFDATLPQRCFHRATPTSIAMQVYEEFEGGAVAKTGGVGAGRQRLFMLHMSTEAEASYTYRVVGRPQ